MTLIWEQEFLKTCKSSSDKNITSLPHLLQQTLEFLSSLPGEIRLEFTQTEQFKKLFKMDKCTGMIIYWEEIDERIRFLWQSMGLKGLSLMDNIVACVNSKNYFPALISTRALLENVSLLHYCLFKIEAVHNEITKSDIIGKIIRREINSVVLSSELEDLLIRYSHGTTLKELIEIQNKWKQERISKYIRFLSKNKSYAKTSEYYSFLCQIAHPSFGSNWAFHFRSYLAGKKEIHDFSKKQDLEFFLKVSAYPLNVSCEMLKNDIEQLRKIKFVSRESAAQKIN